MHAYVLPTFGIPAKFISTDKVIGAMLNYACEAGEAGKAGNGYTATLWRRRQPLW